MEIWPDGGNKQAVRTVAETTAWMAFVHVGQMSEIIEPSIIQLPDAWHRHSENGYARILRFELKGDFQLDHDAVNALVSLLDQIKLGDYELDRTSPEVFLSEIITLCQVRFHPITGPKLMAILKERQHVSGHVEVVAMVLEYAIPVANGVFGLVLKLLNRDLPIRQRIDQASRELQMIVESMAHLTDFTNFFVLGCAWQRGATVSLLGRRGRYFQIGEGSRARLYHRNTSGKTSYFGQQFSRRKDLCNELFSRLGLPVARQLVAPSEEHAVQAARLIGYPVVVKPVDTGSGKGVAVNLTTEMRVRTAWKAAREFSAVIVESFCPGDGFRFLVVDGKFAFATCKTGPFVIGDGRQSVAELFVQLNRKRAENPHNAAFKEARLDDPAVVEELRAQGVTSETVPEIGREIWIRRNSNLSTGGLLTDWTDRVHPDNILLAESAAKVVDVDICGVDLLLVDGTRSWREAGGVICEVNAVAASAHDLGGARIAEYLVPEHANRIPKTILLIDAIDNWDAAHYAQLFCAHHPKGAFVDQDRLLQSPMQVQLNPDIGKRALLDALLFNREIEAIAVAVPQSKLIEVAALLGPIDTIVADAELNLTHQPQLPFLDDVEQISSTAFAKLSA